jgi:hypothetical protein
VGVQEVTWDRWHRTSRPIYIFLRKGDENPELGTRIFVHKRIISEVERVYFVSDRMSYIILRSRCCDITVLNVQAPTEDKIDDMKDSIYVYLINSINTICKFS